MSDGHIPAGLLLQWHVTERCNLRCTHCYQDRYARNDELPLDDLLGILDQYVQLLRAWRRESGRRVWGHITVTGGEPFVRRDFIDLLEIFAANRADYRFAVLTNGTFVDRPMAERLRQLGPTFVQVSMEGREETHDQIRGEGNFRRTVTAIDHLTAAGVRTLIGFTAHRGNYREFADVATIGRRLGVARVWADRLIPWGSGSSMEPMTSEETQEFFEIMRRVRGGRVRQRFAKTEIAMHRALQFLTGGGVPYHCTAGDTLLTLQPNGDVYPCRRMPIRVGNVLEQPLAEIYEHNPLLRRIRERTGLPGCETCSFADSCRGGLLCLSYAVRGNPLTPDPQCWLASLSQSQHRPATQTPLQAPALRS